MNNPAPKILIVDDDDARLMLRLILEMWNYRVIEADDGRQAVSFANTDAPDLILMDVRLPPIGGFDVTRQIRQSAKNSNVPIIFLSGYAEASYKDAAIDAGGNGYLVKPIDFEELELTLGKFIHPARKTLTGNCSSAD